MLSRRSTDSRSVSSSKQNLTKLKQLCGNGACPQATQLSSVIARGPAVAQKTTPAPTTKTN